MIQAQWQGEKEQTGRVFGGFQIISRLGHGEFLQQCGQLWIRLNMIINIAIYDRETKERHHPRNVIITLRVTCGLPKPASTSTVVPIDDLSNDLFPAMTLPCSTRCQDLNHSWISFRLSLVWDTWLLVNYVLGINTATAFRLRPLRVRVGGYKGQSARNQPSCRQTPASCIWGRTVVGRVLSSIILEFSSLRGHQT